MTEQAPEPVSLRVQLYVGDRPVQEFAVDVVEFLAADTPACDATDLRHGRDDAELPRRILLVNPAAVLAVVVERSGTPA